MFGPSNFGSFGFRVVTVPDWPREPDGTQIIRWPAHPLIQWLARWLPIKPYVEGEYPKYRDADPLMDQNRGILYCSPAQADTLRREFKRRR